MKKERLTKSNVLFTASLIPHGNGKLLDYDNPDTGISFRYAQFNTRAIIDCPFRSKGCEAVCYATKGNHQFPSVRKSRERAYTESKRADFAERMVYTIRYHLETKRYRNSVMIVRIHESGDFYSVQYLRKWVKIWEAMEGNDKVQFVFYTKSFRFFIMLTDDEKTIIRDMMKAGQLAINLSIDDTTTKAQREAYLDMLTAFPLANTYRVTKDTKDGDDLCDCANCAKCGACNKAQSGHKVVKIHSASNADVDIYTENMGRE